VLYVYELVPTNVVPTLVVIKTSLLDCSSVTSQRLDCVEYNKCSHLRALSSATATASGRACFPGTTAGSRHVSTMLPPCLETLKSVGVIFSVSGCIVQCSCSDK
jgi:hypothetical protein